jgi:hypothetical protein
MAFVYLYKLEVLPSTAEIPIVGIGGSYTRYCIAEKKQAIKPALAL